MEEREVIKISPLDLHKLIYGDQPIAQVEFSHQDGLFVIGDKFYEVVYDIAEIQKAAEVTIADPPPAETDPV